MITTAFAEPKITIGDVPIMAQNFAWSLIPGVNPFIHSLVIPKGTLNDLLQAVRNPTTIKIEVFGGTNTDPYASRVIEISNVYLLQGMELDNYSVSWQIADGRFAWRGRKLFFSYNKTRAKNEVNLTIPASTDPSVLRRPFDTFASGRYLPDSVKTDGKPYHMIEIVELELAKLGINFTPAISDKGAYMVENVEMEGVDVYHGLTELCARSRLQIGIRLDGTFFVYSVDFFDESQLINLVQISQTLEKTGPGILYRQDMRRIRPRKIHVSFEKKREIRVAQGTSEDVLPGQRMRESNTSPVIKIADIENRRAVYAENVIRVPIQVRDLVTGQIFEVGEYVPMWRFLRAFSLSEDIVRVNWFGSRLETLLAKRFADASGGYILTESTLAAHIVSAIKSHYRQVYQIDPYYMDQIKTWDTRRVTVIDNFSRYTPPSPLYADSCIVPKVRAPHIAKGDAAWQTIAYNWIANNEDPNREKPTAGTIFTVNQPLGIFGIAYPSDIMQVVQEIIPSGVDNIPEISGTNRFWASASLKTLHTMESIISVVWRSDSRFIFNPFYFPDKYYSFTFDYASQGGQGPDIEYLSKLEFARIKVTDTANKPVNLSIIEAAAASEAAKIINQHIDRIVGHLKIAGFYSIQLNGNIKAITYTFGFSGGLETVLDLREIPPAPTTEQSLPQEAIAYLFHQVSRADQQSEVGK